MRRRTGGEHADIFVLCLKHVRCTAQSLCHTPFWLVFILFIALKRIIFIKTIESSVVDCVLRNC